MVTNEQTKRIDGGEACRMLIAYDGSDAARAAVRAAGAIFPALEAVIAHVYAPPPRRERAYLAGAISNEPHHDSFVELERELLERGTGDGRGWPLAGGRRRPRRRDSPSSGAPWGVVESSWTLRLNEPLT